MKKTISILLFLNISYLILGQISINGYHFSAWTAQEIAAANTAADIDYLSEPEKQVILVVNLVRMNPIKFDSTFVKKYLESNENDSYTKSLQKDLRNLSPVPPLAVHKKLFESASNHANALGRSGKTGHNSPNGASMDARFEHFLKGLKYSMYAENIHYAEGRTPVEIVMDLLIDTGIESLGHRKNIFDKDARFIGVAMRPHKVYGTCTVQDFAAFF